MIKWTLLILGCFCIIVTILWFSCSKAKKYINNIGPLFSMISSLLALTVFLQFYNEFENVKITNQEKGQEAKARLNSRMVALGSELINNIQLCNLFEEETENNLKGIAGVPSVYFEYSVMENMVINGDITYHKLRSELTSLIAQMKASNNVIRTQQQLMIFKNIAPMDRQEVLKLRTITSMTIFHKSIPQLRKQLIETEPLFKEQWNNPKKYIDEKYLKDKMLPEALMR